MDQRVLKAFKSLKPILPFSFVVHIFFHDIHAIFLSFSFCPHQKLLIIEFSSLQSEFGSLKQLIVYVGVTWATALMSTSRPALDNNLPFHPAISLPTWSFIQLKAFLFPFLINGGSPRYFSWCWMIWASNFCCTYSFVSLGVFLLKKREVFSLFSFCPDSPS